MKCKKHPKYQAKRPPSHVCPECWSAWSGGWPIFPSGPFSKIFIQHEKVVRKQVQKEEKDKDNE